MAKTKVRKHTRKGRTVKKHTRRCNKHGTIKRNFPKVKKKISFFGKKGDELTIEEFQALPEEEQERISDEELKKSIEEGKEQRDLEVNLPVLADIEEIEPLFLEQIEALTSGELDEIRGVKKKMMEPRDVINETFTKEGRFLFKRGNKDDEEEELI